MSEVARQSIFPVDLYATFSRTTDFRHSTHFAISTGSLMVMPGLVCILDKTHGRGRPPYWSMAARVFSAIVVLTLGFLALVFLTLGSFVSVAVAGLLRPPFFAFGFAAFFAFVAVARLFLVAEARGFFADLVVAAMADPVLVEGVSMRKG